MAASSGKARRAEALAELVDQASRAVYSASYLAGLNPAQWNALRYLSSAQASGRSIKAFSTYHRVTDSAASHPGHPTLTPGGEGQTQGARHLGRLLRAKGCENPAQVKALFKVCVGGLFKALKTP